MRMSIAWLMLLGLLAVGCGSGVGDEEAMADPTPSPTPMATPVCLPNNGTPGADRNGCYPLPLAPALQNAICCNGQAPRLVREGSVRFGFSESSCCD